MSLTRRDALKLLAASTLSGCATTHPSPSGRGRVRVFPNQESTPARPQAPGNSTDPHPSPLPGAAGTPLGEGFLAHSRNLLHPPATPLLYGGR